ncbi:MurR/RpiR family transcriptional regulator [Salipiger sp. P9]|uniref:MurR/RpiR family transcriptional regulator n=1 Tax=Salipiger pentaromativorans TaxID=2943193 RepID=UPI0021581BF2|nr:MurR/RpiR family transcriptional regulator [Salipiger pentaromativorans]MCR8547542.1 MurR/RpiR family transcriptional regulator [Salipiger pentaromativorans]
MASRLILRIQERQARLTSSEKKIAQVLLQNQNLVETHTATELASIAGVSKATTARFFRNLGYADFEEVRLQAREERNRREPYAQLESTPEPIGLGRTISDHLELELRNITRTFEEMRADLMPELASLLANAPRVWFLGFGDEHGMAAMGASMFSRLRHGVSQLQGTGLSWANELSTAGPRDVLVLLTFEPRPKLLRSLLAHARTTRMRIVTVTDHGFQPQAERFSDIVLPCHAASYGVLATHATMLSVLRLMAVAYMGQNPESVSQRIATLAAIDEELDLFD